MTQRRHTADPLVLMVVPVGEIGGVARHILDVIAYGLPGLRVVVLCPPGSLAQRIRAVGGAVLPAEFGPQYGPVTSLRTLRRTIRRLRPAAVHTHLAYADVLGAAALAAEPGIRLISTEHGIAGDAAVYHRGRVTAHTKAAMHRLRLRRTDLVFAVSESTAQTMRRRWSDTAPIEVVPHGIDTAAVRAAVGTPHRRRLGEGLRLLSLSRLSPEKRIDVIVSAMPAILARDAAARLTVAGTGDQEAQLRSLAARLKVAEAIDVVGFVDPWEAMAGHDVLCQLSAWENLSYTLLDAAAAGMPVIATDVGGNGEILGADHLLAEPTLEALVAALEHHCGTHGGNAGIDVVQVSEVSTMTERIAAHILEVLR